MILATLIYSNAQPILIIGENTKLIYKYLFKTEMKPETIKLTEIDEKFEEQLRSVVPNIVKVEPDPLKEMIWETVEIESNWEDNRHFLELDNCSVNIKGDNEEIDKILMLIKKNTKTVQE